MSFFFLLAMLCIFLFLSGCFGGSSLISSYYKEKKEKKNKYSVFVICAESAF